MEGRDVINSGFEYPRTEHPEYRRETIRRATFEEWPIHFMDSDILSAAGFFAIGDHDAVQCFECGVVISRWKEGDHPMVDHRRWAPHCRFVKGEPCGNVTREEENSREDEEEAGRAKRVDYSSYRCSTRRRESFLTNPMRLYKHLAPHILPLHEEYVTIYARLQSFTKWSESLTATVEQLAEAGLVYTGIEDRTYCYHCGGGLKNWETDDDPWIEHARHFSRCYYVWAVKGPDFIEAACRQNTVPAIEGKPFVTPPAEKNANEVQEMKIESRIEPTESRNPCCKICLDEQLSMVMLPCSHMFSCYKCGVNFSDCAICRKPIKASVRAYIA